MIRRESKTEGRPTVSLDAVCRPRLLLRPLRPDFINQGLPNVGVLSSYRIAKMKLYFSSWYQLVRNVERFGCLNKPARPYASMEDLASNGHSVARYLFDGENVRIAGRDDLQNIGIRPLAMIQDLVAVPLYPC